MAKDNRIITRGVRLNDRTFLPDEEDALAAAATSEQIERLKTSGAIEGDWESKVSIYDGDRMSGDGLEAQMLRILLPHVDESGQSEGAVEVIQRIIRERDTAKTDAETARSLLESANERYQVLVDEKDTLAVELRRAKADEQKASELVAQMHAAAVGEVRDPIRGVVEDVADVREQATNAEKRLAELEATTSNKPLAPRVFVELRKAGFDSVEKIAAASDGKLFALWGINDETLAQVRALTEFPA